MAVDYNVVQNAITIPPSYSCKTVPKSILDYDQIAEQINLHNPTIPVSTAKTVIEALRAEIKIQLLAGNTVNLKNFVSFVTTIPVRLQVATDPLPYEPLSVLAKISVTLRDECKTEATYNRLGYPTKAPSVADEFDTNTGMRNLARVGYGMQVTGQYISFNKTDVLQGIFLTATDAGAAVARQTNISLAEPSRAIAIAVLPTFATQNSVEMVLSVAVKYTTGGSLRTGTYSKFVRTINEVDNTHMNLFVIAGLSNVEQTVQNIGQNALMKIKARIRTDGILVMAGGTMIGEYGAEIEVTANGVVDLVLPNSSPAMSIEVTDLTEFKSQLEERGRYVEEVVNYNVVAS